MTTLRRFTCNDLFTFNNVNLDVLTETYNLPFYLSYLAKWPEYCLVRYTDLLRFGFLQLCRPSKAPGQAAPMQERGTLGCSRGPAGMRARHMALSVHRPPQSWDIGCMGTIRMLKLHAPRTNRWRRAQGGRPWATFWAKPRARASCGTATSLRSRWVTAARCKLGGKEGAGRQAAEAALRGMTMAGRACFG